jgi:hypothetical protein
MKLIKRIMLLNIMLLTMLSTASVALAATAATITHLSGPLAVRKADGSSKALAIGSKVDEGDTVVTQKRTYARLKFTDGSEITLKPDTQFKVEVHQYDKANPQADAASYNLIKGGLRTITGQIGKRGDQDSYKMKTPTATIGIRGTIYDAQFCQGDSCGNLNPGLYLAVTDGSVVITNNEGVQTTVPVAAGQYVYVASPTAAPVVLPEKPDVPFNPPPSVGSSAAAPAEDSGSGAGAADCIVR